MKADELDSRHEEILGQASLLYFDGRLTEAAIGLAQKGRDAGKHIGTRSMQDRQHTRVLCPVSHFQTSCCEQSPIRYRGPLIAYKCHRGVCIFRTRSHTF